MKRTENEKSCSCCCWLLLPVWWASSCLLFLSVSAILMERKHFVCVKLTRHRAEKGIEIQFLSYSLSHSLSLWRCHLHAPHSPLLSPPASSRWGLVWERIWHMSLDACENTHNYLLNAESVGERVKGSRCHDRKIKFDYIIMSLVHRKKFRRATVISSSENLNLGKWWIFSYRFHGGHTLFFYVTR
jgi:hypothetical protein